MAFERKDAKTDVLWLQNSMSVFAEILRCILCCSDEDFHETERDYWETISLLRTSNHNSSVGNYSHHNSSLRNSSETQRDYWETPSFDSEQHQLRAKPPASPPPRKSSQSLSGSTLTTKDAAPKVLKKPLSQEAPSSSQPTLSPFPSDSTNQQKNDSYLLVEKGASNYKIPKDVEDLVKKDIVPDVLKKPLSPSTYKDYFAALLYAEDFYIEKWSGFQLFNVTLEVHKAAIYDKSLKNKNLKESDEKDDKLFVAFEIDCVPERRPFLLSRDFVHARRSGSNAKEFQGILYRVVKSNVVLVEFEEDFYSLHHPKYRYDISFSFNRVCLKRAHQAIAAASRSLFENYLFPDFTSRKNISSSETCLYGNRNLDSDGNSAVRRILSLHGRPPYLVEGPLCATSDNLSKTGWVVREAVLEIYKRSSKCRILVCAPINRTGDVLMRSLKKKIPKSDMFRANAAFREVDGVPVDILPLCLYEGGECFQLPSLQELMRFRVIFSTFTSSFRLHNEGIPAGHFSHIFLVDASSATEPETMIALTNLANENTTVILTGAPNNRTSWVRSDIARKNGLRVSHFERLHATKTYSNFNPMFITMLSQYSISGLLVISTILHNSQKNSMSVFVEILRCILCCSNKDCHETERAPGRQSLYWEHRITTLLSGILVLLTTIYCVEMIQANSITTDITRMYQLGPHRHLLALHNLHPSSQASLSLSNPALPALSQSLSSPKPPSFNSEQHQLRAKPPASPSPRKSSQSLSGSTLTTKDAAPKVLKKPSSQKAPSSSQPTLSPFPSDSTNQRKNDSYLLVEKGASNYKIPKDIEDLVKKDIVPDVLKKPLSPSTYKDYFAARLDAEDFYYEKWSDFQLLNVTLELGEATLYAKSLKNRHLKKHDKKDVRFFVTFEIDSIPGKRPFLLSRDFVYAQCSGGISRKFQHQQNCKYDLASHSTECLKRAHQSTAAVSDQLFQNCLFPVFACRKHIPSSEPHFYGNYALIVLSNLANENTTVIVSGASYDHPRWIRSHIDKKNGLEMNKSDSFLPFIHINLLVEVSNRNLSSFTVSSHLVIKALVAGASDDVAIRGWVCIILETYELFFFLPTHPWLLKCFTFTVTEFFEEHKVRKADPTIIPIIPHLHNSQKSNMSVLVKILRCIFCCYDEDYHDTERDYQARLLGTYNHNSSVRNSSYHNSSVRNSSFTNHDLLRQHDSNKIYYYEYYPNVSISEPTTKQPNAMSQQTEYGDKSSLKGNNEVSQSLKSSRPSPPSSSCYTCSSSPNKSQSLTQLSSFPNPASASSKPFLSPKGPAPSSSSNSSSSFPKPAIPSSKASSSLSSPASSALSQSLSSLKPHSFNYDQHQLTAKPPESLSPFKSSQSSSGSTSTKNDTAPKVLNKPLLQKAPPSSQPTLAPLPPDSTNQQEKDSCLLVEKGSSNYKIPKDIEDLSRKDVVPNVLKKPLSPSTYKDYFAALPYAEDFYHVEGSSSVYMPPKNNENLMKKEAAPEVLKKPSSPLSQKTPSSLKPALSPVPNDCTNQQTKGNRVWVQRGTSPVYFTHKNNENLMKKEAMPEVLTKPSYPSSHKSPSSSNPTPSPLPSDSTNQQTKGNDTWVQKGTLPVYMTPKNNENFMKKEVVHEVLKKPSSPLFHKASSSSKPMLSPLPTDSTNQQKKASFIWVQKGATNYKIPKDIEDLIKKDIVPEVLKKPLLPSTYKDYFAALLYAEDFYEEAINK
ncbi:hypothetical protein WN944_019812 [Citrus x changshan-huyou]